MANRTHANLIWIGDSALYICGLVLVATWLILGSPGVVRAQSPPTGLVSVNRLGNGSGNQPALNNALSVSADGRYVAFVSDATDLALNDTNFGSDVFVRDRQTGQTHLVSVNAAGTGPGNQASRAPTITPDGRFVVFQSASSNFVTDEAAIPLSDAVWIRDLQLGTTTLVNRNFAGTGRGNGSSGFFDPLGVTPDGRFVVFTSFSTDLVATPDNNNQSDVFVRDLQTNTTKLVSLNRNGTGPGNNVSKGGVMTPDGRFIAFISQARDLIPMDIGFRAQVFVRDLQTDTTRLVTFNRLGTGGSNADPDFRQERDMAISPDGRFIAYVSEASDLIENDSGFTQDVFVRDTQLGVTVLISVNSAGNGTGNGTSGQIAMTPDARFVTFISGASNLVANDSNLQQDVFIRDLQTSTTTLISVNLLGNAGGNGSPDGPFIPEFLRPAISDDGRYVTFTSSASNLTTATDTNGGNSGGSLPDLFVRDRQTGTTTLVSTNNGGSDSGNGISSYSGIARDGRSIFYFSGAGNLVGYDSNGGVQDLFVFQNVQQEGQVRFKTAVTSASENAGSATVVVSLLGSPGAPVSIAFSTSNGSAASGTDYVSTSGNLTFGPGETEKTFTVLILDEPLDEHDETIVLRLSSINGAPLGEPATSVILIVDDDPAPELRVSDVTVGEGDAGTIAALFTVSLSAQSGRSISVIIATQGGTATSGNDFRPGSAQLTFIPGQTARQVIAVVDGDAAIEGVENFFVNLSDPVNAVIMDGQGECTIIDDDALILLTETNSARATALNSSLFTRDPFPIIDDLNFSADRRTRIALFAVGLKLLPGENASAVTATAEDSGGNVRPLAVEFVGSVPSFNWLTQVVLKLEDQTGSGDVRVKITLHSVSSNVVLVGIRP